MPNVQPISNQTKSGKYLIMIPNEDEIIAAMQKQNGCSLCFGDNKLQRAYSAVPQPRWFGTRYRESQPRIVVVMINPGGGGKTASQKLKNETKLFQMFHDSGNYDPVREYFKKQQNDGAKWFNWYEMFLGRSLDEIALINMAWCATIGNRYPMCMLKNCYKVNTQKLLGALKPEIILLSGYKIHPLEEEIKMFFKEQIPLTINIPHYANRKGDVFIKKRAIEVRDEIRNYDGRQNRQE